MKKTNSFKMKSLLSFIFMMVCFYGISQETITVEGLITDNQNEPLIGVSVMVEGEPSQGTVTDIDGRYMVTNVPARAKLVYSYVGMQSQTVAVNGRKVIDVVLLDDAELLDEVVITAFGTGQKKASIVGSVQTISPGELKVPSSNLSTSFAGRMAGVIAFQRSGQPGADGANFYIRGISTISGATSPLIILDGVQVSSADLNALEPEVIEGFSILKDATATALYGSRGANGVMIVTTKSGANLAKPRINFRIEGNVAQPTNIPEFVDGVTYMNLYNEGVRNLSSGVVPYSQDKIQGTMQNANPYIYPNVDWYNEMFKDHAFNQKFNFNIRGGGQKLDYFLSASINHETGMIKGRSEDFFSFDNNIDVKRYAFQNNINAHLGDNTRVSLRLNAQMVDRREPSHSVDGLFGYTMSTNPVDFPIMFEDDGATEHIKWGAYGGTNQNPWNPVAALASGYADHFESTVIANLEFEQKLDFLTEGLKFNALASFKNWSSTSAYRSAPYNTYLLTSYNKLADGTYEYEAGLQGTEQTVVLNTTQGSAGDRRLYFQGILDYNRLFNDVHSVNALFVYDQDEYNINNIAANSSYGMMINSLPKRKQGLAARLSYGYDNRYLFEVNAGYNGSENFASGHRWGFFPSVALGYTISEESYFEPLKNVIQLLKIRGSWGLVGNDQIGGDRFVYLPKINLTGRGYTTGRDQNIGLNGPSYDRYANYGLTWEVGEKINLGLDLRMLDNLNLNLDFFREKRSDIFQQRGTIANYLGTAGTVVYGNTAEVLNKGFDLSLDYGNRITKDLTIFMKGTFTFARNEILKFDEPSDQQYDNLVNVGKRLNSLWGYVDEGLFIDEAEIANRPTQMISGNVAPGDIKYKDFYDKDGNKDGQIDNNDRMALGYPHVPEIVYGFGPSITYKKWDLGFFFQGVANTSLMMTGFHPFGTNTRQSVLKWIGDSHWSPDNQDIYADYPRLTKDDHNNNRVASSYWLRDASFLKLKNAEIGYSFNKMRLYVSGTNLLTFSKFKHWDPEQGGGSGLKYPTQRVFNIGFQMTIN